MSGTTIKGLKANLEKLRVLRQLRPDLELDDLAATLEQLLGEKYDRQKPKKAKKRQAKGQSLARG